MAAGVLLLAAATVADDVTGVVYLIRHGEKESPTGCLSAEGQARAETLPDRFDGNICERPDVLFAHNYTSEYCQRCVQFLEPLARDRQLVINDALSSQPPSSNEEAAAAIRESLSARPGSTVLVAWEHHNLPKLAEALIEASGSKAEVPEEWPADDFTTLYIIVFEPGLAGGGVGFSIADYNAPQAGLKTGLMAKARSRAGRTDQRVAALMEPSP